MTMGTHDGATLAKENESLRQRVAELEALIESQREMRVRSRRVLESLPQKLFLKDLQSRFVMVNAAFAAEFGLQPQDMVGKSDLDFSVPDLAAKYRADDQRVMQKRQATTLVEPHDVGGVRRFVEVTKAPVIDEQQNVVGVVGIFSDVTGRVRAESQLRQSRRLLQAILDNSQALISIKDAEGRYLVVNRRYTDAFGKTANQVIGKTDHDLFPVKEADQFRANDRAVIDSGAALEIEEIISLPDGPHTCIVLKFPVEILAGKVVSVGGISTDITERKRAETLLKEGEARKSAILESALDCIITVDHEEKIIEFNRAAEREFLYKRYQVIGKDLNETVFPPVQQQRLQGRVGNYLINAEGSMLGRHMDAYARRADGSVFPVEMSMTVVALQGRPLMTFTLRNVTERKRAEEEVERQKKQLEAAAKDKEKAYGELKDFESQLIHSEKMAVVGQLVAGLAHEINTPVAFVLTNLTNISRNMEELLSYADACTEMEEPIRALAPELAEQLIDLREEFGVQEAAEEIRPLVEAAKKGMLRIRDLVANLRSFSRIDVRGERAFEDLNEGLRATIMLVQPVKRAGIQIETNFGDLPRIECNLGQINQVFLNLLTNAIQALGEKGHILVATAAANHGVEVRVRDNGPGIPKEIYGKIFDPFFTTKPVGEGTGLGLSISRRIVDHHRGQLEFTSEPGQGTEFRLWLPLTHGPAEAEEAAAARTASR